MVVNWPLSRWSQEITSTLPAGDTSCTLKDVGAMPMPPTLNLCKEDGGIAWILLHVALQWPWLLPFHWLAACLMGRSTSWQMSTEHPVGTGAKLSRPLPLARMLRAEECGALTALLDHLGYDGNGEHPEGRRLVLALQLRGAQPRLCSVHLNRCSSGLPWRCLADLGRGYDTA